MRKPKYVLDSFALLAYLQAEKGGQIVKGHLEQARKGEILASLSQINLGEILYIAGRRLGAEKAKEIFNDLIRLPIRLEGVTLERILAAAEIKSHYTVSYADAFAVALSQELSAKLVTGDPEFKQVESIIDISWI